MRSKRFAVYTVVTGAYEEVMQPLAVDDRFDFILFTDTEGQGKRGVWQQRSIPAVTEDSMRLSRYPKMRPELLLPGYDGWLYIDANVRITGQEIYDRAVNLCDAGIDWAGVMHPDRSCIYEEAYAVSFRELEKESVLQRWGHRLRKEGYPRGNGLFENNIIFRSNTPATAAVDEEFWNLYVSGPRRDQLILMYVLWKHPEVRTGLILPEGEHSLASGSVRKTAHDAVRKHSYATDSGFVASTMNRFRMKLLWREKEFVEGYYRYCSVPPCLAGAALLIWTIFIGTVYGIPQKIKNICHSM